MFTQKEFRGGTNRPPATALGSSLINALVKRERGGVARPQGQFTKEGNFTMKDMKIMKGFRSPLCHSFMIFMSFMVFL